MPIYEYKCDACDSQFEVQQKLSEPRLEECPRCRAPNLRKLVSAPAFRLKGSGWYETDFKSDRKRNLADGGGDKSAGGEAAASGSSAAGSSGGDGGGKSESAATGGNKRSTSDAA